MAQAVFWLCVALIVYTYTGYPLLLRFLGMFFRRSLPNPCVNFPITFMIVAHNEAASIEAKLLNTLSLDYPSRRLQIMVVSDGSSDGTDSVVERFANSGVELIRIAKQAGKTHAQNIAIESALGEIIVFSDATTHYDKDALRFLAGNYCDPRVGAVSGRYLYINPEKASATSSGASAYAEYDNKIRALQSRIGSITGCCGCIYSIRRSLYTPLADDIISDLVEPLHILKRGYRVLLDPRAVATEYATTSTRQEFSMRVRVIARALRGMLSVHELLLPWKFPWTALQLWSHKLLRWTVPICLAGVFVASAYLLNHPLYRAAFVLQLFFYAAAGLEFLLPLHRAWRPMGIPLYFCTVNAAAIGGICQLVSGRRHTIWSPDRGATEGSAR